MSMVSYFKGKRFERQVHGLLMAVQADYPDRVSVVAQAPVPLRDGRTKVLDFAFEYRMASARHQIGIECQDRRVWSSVILDKILAIRMHSFRNRFWYIHRDDRFLTPEVVRILDSHGVLHFSVETLECHLDAVRQDLAGAQAAAEKWSRSPFHPTNSGSTSDAIERRKYDPPSDAAMTSR